MLLYAEVCVLNGILNHLFAVSLPCYHTPAGHPSIRWPAALAEIYFFFLARGCGEETCSSDDILASLHEPVVLCSFVLLLHMSTYILRSGRCMTLLVASRMYLPFKKLQSVHPVLPPASSSPLFVSLRHSSLRMGVPCNAVVISAEHAILFR